MNLALRGLSADLGKTHGDTFGNDQFPDLKFDYIMANPPFNISDWGGEKYENDIRWKYGRPPVGNANYAWLQHMLWKLKPGGQAGIVLANGSMNSDDNIRISMIQNDVVEVMIALPDKLFLNTPIPVCLWFLTNDKTKNGRDRRSETLFIDARNFGKMETRVIKILDDKDIKKISNTVSSWRRGKNYKDLKGFCKSSTIKEIEKNNFVLNPGKYVELADDEDHNINFENYVKDLNKDYQKLVRENLDLDKKIKFILDQIK